jgi:hypothetical protein
LGEAYAIVIEVGATEHALIGATHSALRLGGDRDKGHLARGLKGAVRLTCEITEGLIVTALS